MSTASATIRTTQGRFVDRLSQLPWWFLFILLAAVYLIYQFAASEIYSTILGKLVNGVVTTIFVAIIGYSTAIVLGLIAGLGRVSKNVLVFNLATLYVQVIRGVPILVQIFYFAFVIFPGVIALLNLIGGAIAPVLGPTNFLAGVTTQNVDMLWRVIIALAIAYGGFEAETFRAGIQSIHRGQMEAARSLGMSYGQSMFYVILPQAIRRVLPPLGNDFISMLKDSSLVSVLGVRDVTQEARLYAAASFRYPETYNSLAFVYLSMTILLSLLLKAIEGRLGSASDRTA